MTQAPPIEFEGLEEYNPWAGGGHGFLPFEGYVKVRVSDAEPEQSKRDPSKWQAKVNVVCVDEDCVGTPLISRPIYKGLDKNGKNLNRQFADFLMSIGTTPQQIQDNAKAKAKGDAKSTLAGLAGREGYVEVRHSTFQGQQKTEIANWVSEDVYTKAVSIGANRRYPAPQTPGNGVATVNAANIGGAAAVVAAPAQVGNDPVPQL